MRHFAALLVSCASAVSVLVSPDARAAAHPWPVARLEGEYGSLSETNHFEAEGANNQQAFRIHRDLTASSSARGLRGSIGWEIETPNFYLILWFAIADVESRQMTGQIQGQMGNYTMRLKNYFTSAEVGTEFQFWKRIILADVGMGFAYGHTSFWLPGFDTAVTNTDDLTGLALRIGTGLRAPLKFPLTFGVKASLETVWGIIAVPADRATLSLFVELDFNQLEKQP